MLPQHVATVSLRWVAHGEFHFVATVDGGAYVLRRQDSNSRVKRHRHRWLALWVPADSPRHEELALERRYQWAKGAAESHYERTHRA